MTIQPNLDSSAVSIFVDMLVELTNTVFVNSTNITTNIETAVLSTLDLNNKVLLIDISFQDEALLSFPMDGSSLVRGGLRPPLDVEPGYTLTVLDLVD